MNLKPSTNYLLEINFDNLSSCSEVEYIRLALCINVMCHLIALALPMFCYCTIINRVGLMHKTPSLSYLFIFKKSCKILKI